MDTPTLDEIRATIRHLDTGFFTPWTDGATDHRITLAGSSRDQVDSPGGFESVEVEVWRIAYVAGRNTDRAFYWIRKIIAARFGDGEVFEDYYTINTGRLTDEQIDALILITRQGIVPVDQGGREI